MLDASTFADLTGVRATLASAFTSELGQTSTTPQEVGGGMSIALVKGQRVRFFVLFKSTSSSYAAGLYINGTGDGWALATGLTPGSPSVSNPAVLEGGSSFAAGNTALLAATPSTSDELVVIEVYATSAGTVALYAAATAPNNYSAVVDAGTTMVVA